MLIELRYKLWGLRMIEDDHPDKIAREKARKGFDAAIDARKLEITLFWQRSLFFWGFISAAFVGYAALKGGQDDKLRITIASFGVICSLAWCLANRASKYWHETWEIKVESIEKEITGFELFKNVESPQRKGIMWSARRYSVSALAIALSDFTFITWILLWIAALDSHDRDFSEVSSIILIVIYVPAMLWGCRSKLWI